MRKGLKASCLTGLRTGCLDADGVHHCTFCSPLNKGDDGSAFGLLRRMVEHRTWLTDDLRQWEQALLDTLSEEGALPTLSKKETPESLKTEWEDRKITIIGFTNEWFTRVGVPEDEGARS